MKNSIRWCGQKVAYSATFLRSVGWQHAGKICGMRGVIVENIDDPLFLIDWGCHQSHVNKFNLVAIDQAGGLQADVENCKVYGYNESYKRFEN